MTSPLIPLASNDLFGAVSTRRRRGAHSTHPFIQVSIPTRSVTRPRGRNSFKSPRIMRRRHDYVIQFKAQRGAVQWAEQSTIDSHRELIHPAFVSDNCFSI